VYWVVIRVLKGLMGVIGGTRGAVGGLFVELFRGGIRCAAGQTCLVSFNWR
jgi:hypothetical protein